MSHDLIPEAALAWVRAGKAAALATVVETWGSAPRRAGSQLAVSELGEMVGSVSGGCVEGAVVLEAIEAIAAGVPMAPHINISLFARGINIHLQTRLYFADEAQANASDPVLNLIEQPQRRETLLAQRCTVDGKPAYRFDIRIQGEGETVFFDF